MRFGKTRSTALVVAVAVAAAWAAATGGAVASHGTNDPAWIAQAGNGQGQTMPVIANFTVRAVLFRNEGLGTNGPKYRAYGTQSGKLRTTRSNDGVQWQALQDVVIEDPLGNQTPLVMDEIGAFGDAVFTNVAPAPFELYYHNGGSPYDIDSIHRAVSAEGIVFELDGPIAQAAAPNQVITEACCASWKSGSLGPTDVIFQSGGSVTCATGAANFPWNCRYVMAYEANDGALEHVGLAGSGDGLTWAGRASPSLSPGGAGAWDDDAATLGRVRVTPGGYTMYYSGGQLPDTACAGGAIGCWSIGTATSADGVTWNKSATNPATPRSLLEFFSPNDPSTLLNPVVVQDSPVSGDTHDKIYYARITNTGGRDTFLAYTEPAPSAGPTVRISQPPASPSCHRSLPTNPVAFATDTLGAPAGLDLGSLSVTLNGTPVASPPYFGSVTSVDSIVTALKQPAQRIEVSGATIGTGVYTLTFAVDDLEGNPGSASVSFQIDQANPSTTVTATPPSPFVRSPGGSIGTFGFTTTDAFPSCGIVRVIARVTNPLGLVKEVNAFNSPGGAGSPLSSTWVGPSLDPHFLAPGPYTVSFLGVDKAGNREAPSVANTATVTVVP